MNNNLKRVGLVFNAEGNVDFVKSLKEVNSSLRENYNQFKITQAQWDSSISASEKLTKKQEYLSNAYKIQTEKVELLTKQLEELKISEGDNQKAIEKKEKALTQAKIQLEKYGVELKNVESKLHSTVAKTEEFVKSLENTGDKIENVSKKVSVLSGIATAGMAASVKSAMDFETAFTGVEKTVDGTEEQIQELKQGIRDLAKEIPSSTTEISAVAEAAGQLGIETDNVLEFTKTMINMGNATNLSAEEAATTLARFANVTKMSQQDFDKLGSTIVALGNNFATTEAEIANMGMNLASAGTQIGMSQSEIMALATALSSVGLEAEAGGTAFSKLMINMQLAVETGNDSLKDFAKVAGMTVDEFSKAFKEDATSAILAFIKGLSKSGEKGKSAIKILDDMGISETRLRDAILRSTNASELFNKAIKLGNNAWDSNTALTNEASKRYDTLKSKLEIVKNKFLDQVITLGNKLMPTVEKALDGVGKWIDKLDKLNDNQIETILKIGALVVAAGPAITLIGKITSGIGGAVKAFSSFSDALKVANGHITSTNTSVNNLAGVFKLLGNPIGIATTAIGLLVGGLELYDKMTESSAEKTQKFIDEMNKSTEAYYDLKEAQEQEAANNMLYVDNSEKLYAELQKITDENGRIKEGYEARAKFIVNELSNSLGTEISMNNGIIENYKNIQKEIEKTIVLKKANILLELKEEKWTNSLKEEEKAYNDLIKVESELEAKKQEYKKADDEYWNQMSNGSLIMADQYATKRGLLANEVESLRQTVEEKKKIYDEHLANISSYEEASTIILNDDIDAINNWVNQTQMAISNKNKNQETLLTDGLQKYEYNVNYYKQLYDKAVADQNEAGRLANENQLKNNQEALDLTIQSLIEQTSAINENSPDVINAWAYLAENNRDSFMNIINKLPPEVQKTINNMEGVVEQNKMYSLADLAANGILKPFLSLTGQTGKVMNNVMQPMYDEMDRKSSGLYDKASKIATGILTRLRKSFDIHSPSRETKKIFKNVMLGMEEGISDEENNLYNQASDVANNVLDELDTSNNTKNKGSFNNYSNYTSTNNNNITIDYNQLYLVILKALNSCKLELDKDGFIRLVDDRIREVI